MEELQFTLERNNEPNFERHYNNMNSIQRIRDGKQVTLTETIDRNFKSKMFNLRKKTSIPKMIISKLRKNRKQREFTSLFDSSTVDFTT